MWETWKRGVVLELFMHLALEAEAPGQFICPGAFSLLGAGYPRQVPVWPKPLDIDQTTLPTPTLAGMSTGAAPIRKAPLW